MINQKYFIEQWFLCAKACFSMPEDVTLHLRKKWSKALPSLFPEWAKQFGTDLFKARYGYSSTKPSLYPYTELFIESLLNKEGVYEHCKPKMNQHSLCMTHDVDHLDVTPKLIIKRMISERKVGWNFGSNENFLKSLRRLLEFDKSYTQKNSTVFIASPAWTTNPIYWPKQWIIDPSYNVQHTLFDELNELMKEFQCEAGLHGSFYSLSQNFIKSEKQTLEKAIDRKINILRQHWLHIPNQLGWSAIKNAQFKIDSTLGWNGSVGFRGGMARPFQILLDTNTMDTLWEVPLLLMDGPLFCDMNMSPYERSQLVKNLFKILVERGGCMAINWHERAADKSYNWAPLLEEILSLAAHSKFRFLTLQEAVNKYEI